MFYCNLSEEQIVFVFSDNFGSIPYDDPKDIFESLALSEGSATNSFGLVVLKRLVLAYNGTVDAKRKGGVTTVEITLHIEKF